MAVCDWGVLILHISNGAQVRPERTMSAFRFVLPDSCATGLLKSRGLREWHAWRFFKAGAGLGLWYDPGVSPIAAAIGSVLLQATLVDEISTQRRFTVTVATSRTTSPVLLRSSIFDCGRQMRTSPADPNVEWEVAVGVPPLQRSETGASRIYVKVRGLKLEAIGNPSRITAQREAECRMLALTFRNARGPEPYLLGKVYGEARCMSPRSSSGQQGAGVYIRTQSGLEPRKHRYTRVGSPAYSMVIAQSGVGTSCTIAEQLKSGSFKPRARLFGPGTLVSLGSFGRGVWDRRWAGQRRGKPRCTLELVLESEGLMLENPGASECSGMLSLGSRCFAGERRPFHTLRQFEHRIAGGSTSEWLLVPRAAVSAVTALLSVLDRLSPLPLEIQWMVVLFVQIGWWQFGGGRCSRAELTHLTAEDREAILAAVPPGCDSQSLLAAAELSPISLRSGLFR
jgi:hypothetical protein